MKGLRQMMQTFFYHETFIFRLFLTVRYFGFRF